MPIPEVTIRNRNLPHPDGPVRGDWATVLAWIAAVVVLVKTLLPW